MDVRMWSPFTTLSVLIALSILGAVRTQVVLANLVPVSIAENSPADRSVRDLTTTAGTGPFTYTIDPPSSEFKIATAQVQVKAGAVLDYEGGTRQYNLTIVVVDSANPPTTSSGTLTVSITDVNEAPSFSETSFAVQMYDGAGEGTEVNTFTATDPDTTTVNMIASYSITGGNTDNAFTNANGTIKVAPGKTLNAATLPAYILTFEAKDGASSPESGTTTINIAVRTMCSGVAGSTAGLITLVGGAVILMIARYI